MRRILVDFLMLAFVLATVFLFVSGAVRFRNTDEEASIAIEKEKVRDAAKDVVDKGKEFKDFVAHGISGDNDAGTSNGPSGEKDLVKADDPRGEKRPTSAKEPRGEANQAAESEGLGGEKGQEIAAGEVVHHGRVVNTNPTRVTILEAKSGREVGFDVSYDAVVVRDGRPVALVQIQRGDAAKIVTRAYGTQFLVTSVEAISMVP